MKAYAVGQLFDVQMNDEVIEYIHKIDDTLKPFGGRFIIHGAPPLVLEGSWSGDLIVIEFPNKDSATKWYSSKEYQAIAGLRNRNSQGTILIIEGVSEDHKAIEILDLIKLG